MTARQKAAFWAGLFFLVLFMSPLLLAASVLLFGPLLGDKVIGNYFAWAVLQGDTSLGSVAKLTPAFLSASLITAVWEKLDKLFGYLIVGLLLVGVAAVIIASWKLSDSEMANNIWGPIESPKARTEEEFRNALQGYLSGTLAAILSLLGIVVGVEFKKYV